MPDAPRIRPVIGAERDPRPADAAIAALAGRQHGLVTRRQLVELGLGRRAIGHRLEQGRLHPVHRGVYAVGHRVLSRNGVWLAAIMATGNGAVLSHRSAAALLGIRDTRRRDIDVTHERRHRHRAGFEFHQAALPPDEITTKDGIPVTTPARTLLDLAQVLTAQRLERAATEAEIRRLTSPTSLEALAARYPGRPGTPTIMQLLTNNTIGTAITKSDLEDRFLALLDAEGLPRPIVNHTIDRPQPHDPQVDFLRPHPRVGVETDGYATHGTRHAFEQDRARDRALQVAGYKVLRITDRQLEQQPNAIARELRSTLTPSP